MLAAVSRESTSPLSRNRTFPQVSGPLPERPDSVRFVPDRVRLLSFLTGRADTGESIKEAPAEIGHQLKEGLSGEGELVQVDETSDPFIE